MKNCHRKSGDIDDRNVKQLCTPQKGRHPGQSNNTRANHSRTKGTTVRSKARAPALAYAIRAREEATTLDVITSTFSFFDVTVYALIDPRSIHSYICIALVMDKNLPVKSTKLNVQVMNPLG